MFNIMQGYPQIQEILHSQFMQDSILQEAISRFIFAFIAGFGFAYGLNPMKKTIIWSALFAAIGYDIRFLLMEWSILSFAGASFCASFCIGLLAMVVAKRLKSPIEVVVFPSLLPMFPGSYGYKSILSLLTFVQQADEQSRMDYLLIFFNNFMIMFSVSLALVAGILVILSVFYEQSFMMTRGIKRFSLKNI